jgi:hypothetical protein
VGEELGNFLFRVGDESSHGQLRTLLRRRIEPMISTITTLRTKLYVAKYVRFPNRAFSGDGNFRGLAVHKMNETSLLTVSLSLSSLHESDLEKCSHVLMKQLLFPSREYVGFKISFFCFAHRVSAFLFPPVHASCIKELCPILNFTHNIAISMFSRKFRGRKYSARVGA